MTESLSSSSVTFLRGREGGREGGRWEREGRGGGGGGRESV